MPVSPRRRSSLLADGWLILHVSAVTRDGEAVLTLGGKGAGKTTTALLLAGEGWGLLANDRVFVRAESDGGTVRVLPWPSAAAIGLGLLDALGLYDQVRSRLMSGDRLHPTQHTRVTDALLKGDRSPLWKPSGTEMKPQFFPDQLTTWLALPLVTEGVAARFLFPHITPNASPARLQDDRPLTDADFFTAASEDRYPDIFDLLPPEAATAPSPTRELLAALPRRVITLGHGVKANAAFLAEAAAG
ncbi:hypothetical protein D7231_34025 [Streptomyces klenkii]|uniref:Uncharacterized protein n=1 Tax=Streptomyces klenkii TaxID=1420899 RepID=A0A3B0AHH7_9ACTN|nr:hypothetical protein [Streptomyces klenkii]RKN59694.1 hypothetical protein D7231_34025 [Streptomyces klenkii]